MGPGHMVAFYMRLEGGLGIVFCLTNIKEFQKIILNQNMHQFNRVWGFYSVDFCRQNCQIKASSDGNTRTMSNGGCIEV